MPSPNGMSRRINQPRVDWETLGAEFRTGVYSNYQLADKFGVTEGAIRQRAKKHGWKKDLTDAVRMQIREKLVRLDVDENNRLPPGLTSEQQIVEASSDRGVQIVAQHRVYISKIFKLHDRLQEAGERLTKNIGSIGEWRQASTALANMVRTIGTTIILERQAYNLDVAASKDGKSLEQMITESMLSVTSESPEADEAETATE